MRETQESCSVRSEKINDVGRNLMTFYICVCTSCLHEGVMNFIGGATSLIPASLQSHQSLLLSRSPSALPHHMVGNTYSRQNSCLLLCAVTAPNPGVPGARCRIAATRFPSTALQTATSTVENNESPLYLSNIHSMVGDTYSRQNSDIPVGWFCSSDVP